MVELAVVIGVVVTVALRWACRTVVRRGQGAGETGLIVIASTGLMAMAIVALDAGAPMAAFASAVAALVAVVDVRRVRAEVRRRLASRQASTVTPFQNAT